MFTAKKAAILGGGLTPFMPWRPTLQSYLVLRQSAQLSLGQQRHSSFLNKDTTPTSTRQTQRPVRISWFTRRKRERNVRKKISTLAVEPEDSMFGASNSTQSGSEQGQGKSEQSSEVLTRRHRKLLIWSVLLTMPLWGRDLVEAVVPGTLGFLILGAGKIKQGVRRIKNAFQ